MGARAAPLAWEASDRESWNTLPEDAKLLILARLPRQDLARLRTVSKKWMELCISVGRKEKSWYIFNRFQVTSDLIAEAHSFFFNSEVGEWHSFRFSCNSVPVERVMATAGGLLLCVSNAAGSLLTGSGYCRRPRPWPQMVVCNPMKSDCYTTLPLNLRKWRPDIMGMVVDSKSNTYKIVLVSVIEKETEIYDSATKSWKYLNACSPPALPASRPLVYRTHATAHKGCICSVGGGKVVVFDVAKEVWTSLHLPRPDEELLSMQLYDCEGRLLFVGAVICDGPGEEVYNMNVWELMGEFPTSGFWQELSTMPADQIVTTFLPEAFEHDAQDDLLLVTQVFRQNTSVDSEFWDREFDGSQEKAFLYSLSRKAWYFVYKCANPLSKDCYFRFACPYPRFMNHQVYSLRFEPRIEACV